MNLRRHYFHVTIWTRHPTCLWTRTRMRNLFNKEGACHNIISSPQSKNSTEQQVSNDQYISNDLWRSELVRLFDDITSNAT